MKLNFLTRGVPVDRHRIRNRSSAVGIAVGSLIVCSLLAWVPQSIASDHADPIDPFNRERLEGGITDLFVFPVDRNEKPLHPFERKSKVPLSAPLADIVRQPLTDTQMKEIDSIVFILCVRRQLTQTGSLMLEPYSYKIHIDFDSAVTFPADTDLKSEEDAKPPEPGPAGYGSSSSSQGQVRPTLVESFARYGGKIESPSLIKEDLTIEFRLNNHAKSQEGYPTFTGALQAGWKSDSVVKTGVYDDPFIFPAFFGTNVVAMAVKVPISLFPADRHNYLVWATSHQGNRQVDHQGRSLRTQNPRFELLNTLHPSEHVDAIKKEHKNPGLVRDILLRLNFAQSFAYRSWDFVPDVMCFSTRYPVGFPNGRLLTDDVAVLLAQHGDTLLYELSYQHSNGNWPRQMTNDLSADSKVMGVFHSEFPYLLEPHADHPAPPPLSLTSASVWKLIGIAALLLLLLILENWIVARIYYRIKLRKRTL